MIKKLDEFAQNGDKSISGLTLTTGFPRQQKPFRQWMNYLFNWLAVKQNEVIDSINALDLKVEPLLTPIRVGEVFVTTASYTAAEVAERHGYGTWERYAEGRTLVGYSSKTSDLDDYRIMGNEFGANTHTLTEAEMPSHNHNNLNHDRLLDASGVNTSGSSDTTPGQVSVHTAGGSILEAGGDQPHNNIQPSIVVAYWLRTA